MESFEHVARLWLESQGYAVSTNVKFYLQRRGRKQVSPFEVDLVGARGDRLQLAPVKSYFGSRGVHPASFPDIDWDAGSRRGASAYKLFNDREVQQGVLAGASERYGYPQDQVFLMLIGGHFAYDDSSGERAIRDHFAEVEVGGGPVEVIGPETLVDDLVTNTLDRKTYIDDPVVATLRLLREAERL